MTSNSDFPARTFDQLVARSGGDIAGQDVSPHRLVRGEIVFERLGNGLRVTARDEQHRLLWGYVASKETVQQVHCLVAMYSLMQEMIAEELAKHGLSEHLSTPKDDVTAAIELLTKTEADIHRLLESLNVKKTSKSTAERARKIMRLVSDFNTQIAVELGSVPAVRTEGD